MRVRGLRWTLAGSEPKGPCDPFLSKTLAVRTRANDRRGRSPRTFHLDASSPPIEFDDPLLDCGGRYKARAVAHSRLLVPRSSIPVEPGDCKSVPAGCADLRLAESACKEDVLSLQQATMKYGTWRQARTRTVRATCPQQGMGRRTSCRSETNDFGHFDRGPLVSPKAAWMQALRSLTTGRISL